MGVVSIIIVFVVVMSLIIGRITKDTSFMDTLDE